MKMAWREQIQIRKAVVDDAPSILWLIQLLAEYEKEPNALKIEAKDIVRDCFGEERVASVLIAELKSPPNEELPLTGLPSDKMEKNERIVGYGLYCDCYSTWTGRLVYLEDVFVREKYRNQGLGSALMRECAKVALTKGNLARMRYQVLDWNTKAIDLYKRIGGEIETGLLTMRLYRDGFTKLATGESSNEPWKDQVIIRPAVPEDVPEIVQLIKDLAAYLNEAHEPKIGEKELLEDGFNEEKHYSVLVAEIKSAKEPTSSGPKLAGYAIHCFAYSTWEGRQVYVDDLFVREEYRKMGIGKALLRECAKVAVATDSARVFWFVMEYNTEAIKFYQRMGGQMMKEWLTVNMNKDSLNSFSTEQKINNF